MTLDEEVGRLVHFEARLLDDQRFEEWIAGETGCYGELKR